MDGKGELNAPAINIMETNHEYKVEVAAPGLTKDDFSVKLDDDNELLWAMEKKHGNRKTRRIMDVICAKWVFLLTVPNRTW